MAMEPPPFQGASRCDVCKCSFSTFRRRDALSFYPKRHSLVLDFEKEKEKLLVLLRRVHDSVGENPKASCFLTYFDTSIIADVVAELYAPNIHRTKWYEVYRTHTCRLQKDGVLATPNEVNAITDSISRLDISAVSDTKPEVSTEKSPFPGISECKCGMPLCICEAPAPPKDFMAPQARIDLCLPTHSHTLFNPGQVANSSVDISSINYEVTGEGLREAIKNGDTAAAKKLLSQGVDANYRDKQGSSLLHLAAVFNQTEIAFALIDQGASLDCKNSQGETPIDCAPATLQYRMKKKMEEDMQSHAVHE
ncbi:hypothetical protein DH2020_018440 [Rehmannia glutinosa]|uniref:Uncharacterized protein n=1 Tax=Rehmannia glutinosa TaxID=99300 RepID=A0ABR0WKZ7_REHGL